jgi:hypothetical protein
VTISFIHDGEETNVLKKRQQRMRLFFFPGKRVSSPTHAFYSEKAVLNVMKKIYTKQGIDENIMDIYTAYYQSDFSSKIQAFNSGDSLQDPDVEQLTDELFTPLFRRNGQKLDIPQVCQNFSSLILFGACAGSFIMTHMGQLLHQKMSETGYTPAEIKLTTSLINAIHLDPSVDFANSPVFRNTAYCNLSDYVIKEISKNPLIDRLYTKTDLREDYTPKMQKAYKENTIEPLWRAPRYEVLTPHKRENILITTGCLIPKSEIKKHFEYDPFRKEDDIDDLTQENYAKLIEGHCAFSVLFTHEDFAHNYALRQKMYEHIGGTVLKGVETYEAYQHPAPKNKPAHMSLPAATLTSYHIV